MRVLMTAYACHPYMGSEPGYGWNWPACMSSLGVDVCVIARPEWRHVIEQELVRTPRSGLQFVYVPEPDWPLRLGLTLGRMLQYLLWQRAAAHRARILHAEHPFDVVHHVSYGSLLGGSQLWRVGPPLVLGPVGGGQTAPEALSAYFGPYWRRERLRSFAVRVGWRLFPGARACAVHASLVLAGNQETAALARRLGARNVKTMLDVGVPADFLPEVPAVEAQDVRGPFPALVGRTRAAPQGSEPCARCARGMREPRRASHRDRR